MKWARPIPLMARFLTGFAWNVLFFSKSILMIIQLAIYHACYVINKASRVTNQASPMANKASPVLLSVHFLFFVHVSPGTEPDGRARLLPSRYR
ncbi:MAG: hypothetical protein BECKG1743E_GA0114224_107351, partial [Candidatus Kentron sp. G]